jgi:peptidoglycan/xylan/chitin deacetylase (PgdA/CDA1 family)
VLAVVLLVASIGVGGGGGSAHRRLRAHAARPSPERMHAIADAARRRKAAEDRAIDRVLAYTPFVTSGGGRRREVALTFDDGPGPYTPGVLRVLRRFHAKATFFEVGFMERWFHSSTTKAVAEGHAIGDHTESHPRLAGLPRPEQRTQIVSQAEWLGKLGVPRPRLFRPPFGSFDPRTFRILHNQRMLMVLWSVDTGDFSQPGARTIVRRALAGAKPGAIILMHDAGGARSETVAALRELIPALRKRHLDLVTVPQLMLDDPPPHGQRLPHYLSGG